MMLSPFTLILWLVVLAGMLIAVTVHFTLGTNSASVSLADLPSIDVPDGQFDRWMEIIREGTTGVGVELLLYGALTLIGLLLILRAVASAIVVFRQRKYLAPPLSGQVHRLEPDSPSSEAPAMPNGLAGQWSILGRGLTGKMLLGFTGTVALFGFCAAAVVYFTLMHSLREHQLQRATVLAVNVSDVAAGYMVAKKSAELRGLLRKSAGGAATAYIIVEDRNGSVAAHSLADLPAELQPSSDRVLVRQAYRRKRSIGTNPVYETVVPLLDGQAGAVRVGLWAAVVEAEVRRTVAPIVFWVLATIAAGLLCSIYLVWRINRPIVRLVRIASHISRGELDMPLSGTRDAGEFGELSRALERIRSSVKAAMARLN